MPCNTTCCCIGRCNIECSCYEQIKKITYGMTYEEVVDVLGEIKPSKLSGIAKCEWRLANGDTIWIWFSEYSEETGKYVVSGYFVE